MKRIWLLTLFLVLVPVSLAREGSMMLLATSEINDTLYGSSADLYLEVKPGSGRIFIDSYPLTKLDTVMSTRFANQVACDLIETDCNAYDFFYTIRANSAIVGGPSAGAAISILTISVLENIPLRDDVAITGTINSGGLIGPVGGVKEKIAHAEEVGMKKILIPRWSSLNISDNSTEDEEWPGSENNDTGGAEIIKVSSLRDAFYEFTGKDIGKDYSLIISKDYLSMMEQISDDICSRSIDIEDQINGSFRQDPLYEEAEDLLDKGKEASASNKFYSAASYCFGANTKLRYLDLLEQNLTDSDLATLSSEFMNTTIEKKDSLKDEEIKTMTDLQSYMVVTERYLDSMQYFKSAAELAEANLTNQSVSVLAFGIERLNSAESWSRFFGTKGTEFEMDQDIISDACLKKISEVEERIEYITYYAPLPLSRIRDEIKLAYGDYDDGEYSLCLFKASKAKADLDIILNSMGIPEKDLDSLIEERKKDAENIIGRQIANKVFPIVGYSYYEYAISLKDSDKYSSLLYLEYAIELSNLDIYFEEKRFRLPRIDISLVLFFVSGFMLGFSACFVWIRNKIMRKRRRRTYRYR